MTNRVDRTSLVRAHEVLRANLPPRYHRLDRLKRYVDGTQYEGRRSWWDESVPLMERAPCIQYPIAKRALDSNCDMVLGEGRFPTFTTGTEEDDTDTMFDERFGLSKSQSRKLDKFIKTVANHAQLQTVAKQVLGDEAQGCGTAAVIGVVRNGCLRLDVVEAKTAQPTYAPGDPETIASLEIRYPYIDEYYNDARRQWEARVLMYRRTIDAQRDVVYHPVVANDYGEPITNGVWRENFLLAHGLGFCPVVWYRFQPKSTAQSIDGKAPHAHLLDEIDGLNRSLSMHHRAALVSGDPQIVETGVALDEQVGPMGDRPRIQVFQPGDVEEMKRYGNVGGAVAMQQVVRRKGAGVVWRYENPTAKVEYLTLQAGALEVLDKDSKGLLEMLKEALAVVFVEPGENTNMSGEISGRALEWLHKKQTESCDDIRADFGLNFLLAAMHMLLRIVHVVANRAAGALYVPGLAKALPILKRFEAEIASAASAANENDAPSTRWFKPYIRLIWPPYFKPTSADAKVDLDGAIAAKEGGLITEETAVRKIASHFGIDDVPSYLETLREEKAARVREAQAAMGGVQPDADGSSEVATAARPSLAESSAALRQPGAPEQPQKQPALASVTV